MNNQSGTNEVYFCKRCVISNLRPISTIEAEHIHGEVKPTTHFIDGVCDACRWAEMKESIIDWDARNKELKDLTNAHRTGNGNYDVIVPASGGKDSCYVAHYLKEECGMNPLTVTWAPHIWTETGIENHQNLIRSGFDNILVSPNGDVHRKLTRLAIENIGHPFQPFIFGQRTVGPKFAMKFGVKLVFYGENVAEYGNRIEDNYVPTMDRRLYTCYDIYNDSTLLAGVDIKTLREKHGIGRADLIAYHAPSLEEIKRSQIEVHYMSYYRKWVPQENFYYAMQHTAFEPAPTRTTGSYSKYSGLDDKIEWFHYYMMYIKYGLGRATADASQEIRTDKITRKEAVNLVHKYDGEFPQQHVEAICEYTGMTADELIGAIDTFRLPHLWEKEKGQWKIKYQVEDT